MYKMAFIILNTFILRLQQTCKTFKLHDNACLNYMDNCFNHLYIDINHSISIIGAKLLLSQDKT